MNQNNEVIEKVGVKFDLIKFMEARRLTIDCVHKIANEICEGMSESTCLELLEKEIVARGGWTKWHPSKFRIGKNTLKSFREKSDEEVILKANDVFFMDIGPVFEGHEGDYGETFWVGNNLEYKNICFKVKEIFAEVKNFWKKEQVSGKQLYVFAEQSAKKNGYLLNLKMNGHRIGDFPHAVHFRGSLDELDFTPQQNLWVLEILIRHPTKDFGAFYEDLLT